MLAKAIDCLAACSTVIQEALYINGEKESIHCRAEQVQALPRAGSGSAMQTHGVKAQISVGFVQANMQASDSLQPLGIARLRPISSTVSDWIESMLCTCFPPLCRRMSESAEK